MTMTEVHQQPPRRRMWQWMQQNEDAAFAVIMAGVAALFIISIVSAFNFAGSDIAESPPATPPVAIAARAPAETTGSGGGERPRPPLHDPREDEQMERPR
jgi:hypothetical protein